MKLITIALLVNLVGCALTAPEGKKELLDDIERDRLGQKVAANPFYGRPIFLKVRAYPRIEGGSVYGKHWILFQTGREKVDLENLMSDLNEESENVQSTEK